jgi:hypothetical protein
MWLVLTQTTGDLPVHVNMELVTYMWRVQPDATQINFDKENYLLVKETPEEIRAGLESWMSEPEQD